MRGPKLLTRDEFREGVFSRDSHKCVVCKATAADAHHILERRLWPDGGYYLDNGASVCEPCHLKAEQTMISCEELRALCGAKLLLPEHMSEDDVYDKWGNPILPNGQRMRGELFEEEPVQKALKGVLHLFTNRVKYPRTFHMPFSPGRSADDKVLADLDHFDGQEVVATIKMDGECTTLYRDGLHARSLSYDAHPSRDWIRALHGRIAHEIPETWRICGENLYARHSIYYSDLPSYFMVFSIWDGLRCLSWEETVEWSTMLGLTCVPLLYRGSNHKEVHACWQLSAKDGPGLKWDVSAMEGYVLRLAGEFRYSAFRKSVAKYVRANHVQSSNHWMHERVVPNGLAKNEPSRY